MKSRKSCFLASMVVAVFLCLAIPSDGSAVTITFDWSDFLISTVTNVNYPLTSNPASAPALPADSTFTLTPVLPASSSDPNYFDYQVGKFQRYTFVLPAGYSDLTFSFRISVNDWFAAYINDTVVAIQTTTSTSNFFEPLPGFSMNTAGAAVDTSGKLEYLLTSGMQALFQPGTNELTVFGRDTVQWGGFGEAYGEINYNVTQPPPTGVPEPHGIFLLGCGLFGLWKARRRLSK